MVEVRLLGKCVFVKLSAVGRRKKKKIHRYKSDNKVFFFAVNSLIDQPFLPPILPPPATHEKLF